MKSRGSNMGLLGGLIGRERGEIGKKNQLILMWIIYIYILGVNKMT